MKISVNKAHFPVTVLGPGRRAGIWVQGCTLHCPGCVSTDTWDRRTDTEMTVTDLVGWVAGLGELDGVTISGGEPFQQPEALSALLVELDEWRRESRRSVDFLVYSGYTKPLLDRVHADLVGLADAVITGRYLENRPTNLIWRGSENQQIHPLSDLGRQRYSEFLDQRVDRARLQTMVDADSIWYVGVPLPGDMQRIDEALRQAGVIQEEVSWKS